MRRIILLAAAASLFLSGIIIARPAPPSGEFSFADRLKAQEAIERVYYSHQMGATLPFEQAVSRSLLEEKVRTYLEQSAALESYWHTPVTAEMLEAEVQRITSGSRLQERLGEIYAALHGDPLLIDECFARPLLVDRLTRSFFAFDRRIHAAELESAQQLREGLVSGRISIEGARNARIVEKVTRVDSERRLADRAVQSGSEESSREAEPEEYRQWRSQAPARVHEIGPLQEGRFSWSVRVVLEEGSDWARIASYVIPKREYESWWKTARREFQSVNVRAVVVDRDSSARRGAELGRIDTAGPAQPETNSPASCQPDDTWSNGGALAAPPFPGTRGTAIWTGTQMIVWGGSDGAGATNRGARYDPLTDTWTPTSPGGAPVAREGHTAIWTGSRMIVWGGAGEVSVLRSGGSYDPATDTWTSLATAGAPSARTGHSAVWTGTRMIVWGGQGPLGSGDELDDGSEYNPSNDHWSGISNTGAPSARHGHTAIWTGTEMIVWGGGTDTGARYNPGSNQWTPTTTIGAPSDRSRHTAIWTGSRMIVWGGSVSGTQVNDGKSYDPSADAWSTISTLSAPSPREAHSAIWTGSRMIVWGGMFINHIPTPPVTFYLNTGGSYDPAANSWTPLPTLNAPAQRLEPLAVWTGTRMIVWGGDSGTVAAFASGGRFDPASNSWTPTATTRRPPRTHGAWTGALWILWNGSAADPGARYDPLTDSWSDISNVGAPPPRTEHIPLWTGSRMLVWGGSSDPQLVQGGRYDPVSNSWSPMSTIGAPYGRINHTAVWTGSQMLIWGGEYLVSSSDFAIADDGRKYDPVADAWSPIPTTGSPSARYGHVAVWTGTRMVVWGGTGSSPGLVSGGIFNPATDSWSSTSLSGVPEPRRFATAIWTGSRMVVWGGYNQDTFSFVDSGGLFDPDTNAWTSTALHNAPSPRIDHSAVWTGSRMIIFGGQGIGPVSRDGSRFDPVSNSWAAISLVGGPPAMYRHAAAWTGGSMLIYQGSERGGGQYFLDQAVDNDGDGFSECSGDCRDQDPAVHPGAVELCDGVDNDCNGLIDDGPDADGDGFAACNGDCNDADPGAWAYPPEVMNVQPDGTSASVWVWDAQSQLVGPGVLYEVASGPIGPGGAQLTAGACLGTVSSAQFTDAQPDPALGWGTWFLVRSKNSCQEGSYGTDSLGGERLIPSCP